MFLLGGERSCTDTCAGRREGRAERWLERSPHGRQTRCTRRAKRDRRPRVSHADDGTFAQTPPSARALPIELQHHAPNRRAMPKRSILRRRSRKNFSPSSTQRLSVNIDKVGRGQNSAQGGGGGGGGWDCKALWSACCCTSYCRNQAKTGREGREALRQSDSRTERLQ